MKNRRVAYIAMKDISNYLRQQYPSIDPGKYPYYSIVSPECINTKQTRALNKQLGLHKINKSRSYNKKG